MTRSSDRRVTSASVQGATERIKPTSSRPGIIETADENPSVRMGDGSLVYPQWQGERADVGAPVTVSFPPPSGAFITAIYGGTVRLLGEAEQTQDQDVVTEEEMFDLRCIVSILAPGRRVMVTLKVYCESEDADAGAQLRVYDEDGDPVGDDSGRAAQAYVPVAGGNFMLTGFVVETPDVGDRTYQATLARVGASGTISALCSNSTARMIVQDLGPAQDS